MQPMVTPKVIESPKILAVLEACLFLILVATFQGCKNSPDSIWKDTLYPLSVNDDHLHHVGPEKAKKDLSECRNIYRAQLRNEYSDEYVWYIEKRLAKQAITKNSDENTHNEELDGNYKTVADDRKLEDAAQTGSTIAQVEDSRPGLPDTLTLMKHVGMGFIMIPFGQEAFMKTFAPPKPDKKISAEQLKNEDRYNKFLAGCLADRGYKVQVSDYDK